MALTPGEQDRLLLFTQAQLARARRARGLRLNIPEARALVADAVCEWARDGRSLEDVRTLAQGLLGRADVLPGVPESIGPVQVEARFDDGTRLVVIEPVIADGVISGGAHPVVAAAPVSQRVGELTLVNEAATPVGITSHIHLAEVNPRIRLDRAAAFGPRLAIAAGETVWLAAGESRTLPITPIAGARAAIGTTGLVEGALDDPQVRARALAALRACGYLDIVDGQDVGVVHEADEAVARIMTARLEASDEGKA